MKKKHKIIIVLSVAVCVLVAVGVVIGISGNSKDKMSVYDAAVEQGYDGSAEDYIDSMDEDTEKALRECYNDDVEDGYDGSFSDWISTYKTATLNAENDIQIERKNGDKTIIGKIEEKKNEDSKGTTLVVSDKSIKKGDKEFSASVSIKNNPGLLGMVLSVSYDENAMELADAQEGSAFKGVLTLTKPKKYKSGCQFLWDGVELKSSQIKDGEILKLYFKLLDGAKKGTYKITAKPEKDSNIDENLESVSVSNSIGTVTVK